MMLNSVLLVLAWVSTSVAKKPNEIVRFNNVGFDGSYTPVSALNDPESDQCSCSVGSPVSFSGPNSPFDDELAVVFRGPMQLLSFYAYTSDDFVVGSNDSSWTTVATYNGTRAENLTFLTPAGADSKCLGKALTYADSDGVSKADKPTMLAKDTVLKSDQEVMVFSSQKCGDSKPDGDCGVYRKGIPAYHGFEGKAKLFLFTWYMVDDPDGHNSSSVSVLNAQIPRTSQNYRNKEYGDCSCWRSGCGELVAFNATGENHDRYKSTLYDLQSTNDIDQGISSEGYFLGTKYAEGGVLFDSNGTVTVISGLYTYLIKNQDYQTSDQINVVIERSMKLNEVIDVNKPSKKNKSGAASIEVPSRWLAVVLVGMIAWMS